MDVRLRLIDALALLPLQANGDISPQDVRNLLLSVHYENTRVDYAEKINSEIDIAGWTESGPNMTVVLTTTGSEVTREGVGFLIEADGGGSIGDFVDINLLDIAPVDDAGQLTAEFEYRALAGYSPGDIQLRYFDNTSSSPLLPTAASFLSDGKGFFSATAQLVDGQIVGTKIRFQATVATAFKITVKLIKVRTRADSPGAQIEMVTFWDEQAAGVNAAAFTSGADRTVPLNTDHDPMTASWYVSLIANQIKVKGGRGYAVFWDVPAITVDGFKTWLHQVTAPSGIVTPDGMGNTASSAATDNSTNISSGFARVYPAEDTTYEIRARCNASGFFGPAAAQGTPEVYARAGIIRIL